MQKIQKHIEIVRSSTPSLSSMSLKSSNALYTLLSRHYETVGVTTVNTAQDLEGLVSMQPNLVFIGLKYLPGIRPKSKVWVSSYLTQHGIAHTGSPWQAIEFEQNKSLAKARMLELGVSTSPYTVIKNGEQYVAQSDLSLFPLFVKPVSLGAGQGVDDKSIVHNQTQLDSKLASLSVDFQSDALVEKYLAGREFSVAILRDEHTDEIIGMPLELLPGADVNGDRMLSYRLKSGALETPVGSVDDPILKSKLIKLAKQAFVALGARDYGRVDIRLDAAGVPHFLEANLIPCIIEGSGNFPKACLMNRNMDYSSMILHIVRLGLQRSNTTSQDHSHRSDVLASPTLLSLS
jgi:D-alanine-D-alanine ligase